MRNFWHLHKSEPMSNPAGAPGFVYQLLYLAPLPAQLCPARPSQALSKGVAILSTRINPDQGDQPAVAWIEKQARHLYRITSLEMENCFTCALDDCMGLRNSLCPIHQARPARSGKSNPDGRK
jgi:hypothetical protein